MNLVIQIIHKDNGSRSKPMVFAAHEFKEKMSKLPFKETVTDKECEEKGIDRENCLSVEDYVLILANEYSDTEDAENTELDWSLAPLASIAQWIEFNEIAWKEANG